jgi:hypothetical protein
MIYRCKFHTQSINVIDNGERKRKTRPSAYHAGCPFLIKWAFRKQPNKYFINSCILKHSNHGLSTALLTQHNNTVISSLTQVSDIIYKRIMHYIKIGISSKAILQIIYDEYEVSHINPKTYDNIITKCRGELGLGADMDIQHMVEWMQTDRDEYKSVFAIKVNESSVVNAIFWMPHIMVCIYNTICRCTCIYTHT